MKKLLVIVNVVEKIVYGNVSGVDVIMVVSEKLVWYEWDWKLEIMYFLKKIMFVVVDIGVLSEIRDVVKDV